MFSAALKSGAASAPTDPQFKYVTMLLHGDGTNGAQNNTFLDSSSNAFSITRNGNTTQGTFSPYGANWSNYSSGSDYLQYSSVATGTGTWTVEAWVFITSPANARSIFSQGTSDNSSCWLLWVDADGTIRFYSNSNLAISSSGAVPSNVWAHVALVSNASNVTIYVNGTSVATGSYSGKSFNGSPFQVNQGYGGSTSGITGYISNARVVVGTAVYTSSFTPSTTPLTAITNTQLLTCQSNRFKDNSSNNYTATVGGSLSVQRFSPFAPTSAYSASVIGGSGYFDGNGDYLTAPDNFAFAFGSGAFTIEAWVYVTATKSVGNPIFDSLPLNGNGARLNAVTFYIDSSNKLSSFNSGSNYIQSPNAITLNCWTHTAITSDGSTVRLFVNGDLVATASRSMTLTDNSCNVGVIANIPGDTNGHFQGYISGERIVKGAALYTSSFTVPTAPISTVSGTSLLLNMTNAGILDNAEMNDLETVGNAQISTSVKKYGTGSLAFDGNGDALKYLTNPLSNIGSGDFTIEFWINANSWTATTSYSIAQLLSPVNVGSGLSGAFNINSDPTFANAVQLYSWGGGSSDGTVVSYPLSSLSTGTWYHFAFTRSSGTTRMFVNGSGVSTSSKTYTGDFNSSPLYIGGGPSNGWFNGYIDDLRITKGYARYTANFTPPTAAFPNQ